MAPGLVKLAYEGRKDGSVNYREKVGVDSPSAERIIGQPMPCLYCGRITAHLTLRTLGARCEACYAAYLSEHQPAPSKGLRRDLRQAVKVITPEDDADAILRREDAKREQQAKVDAYTAQLERQRLA